MYSKFNYSFSRLKQTILLLICISFFTVSCHIKTGEKAPPVEPFSFGVSCLDKAYENLNLFFQGDGTNEGVQFASNCAVDVLSKFKDKVRGAQANQYSANELRSFIENNFLNTDPSKSPRNISDSFLNQLMLIKQLIIGGDVSFVTIEEIDQTVDYIKSLENQLYSLNPYMKIYIFKWQRPNASTSYELNQNNFEILLRQDIEIFEAANKELQSFVDQLAIRISKNNIQYSLDNFPILASEIDFFDNISSNLGGSFQKYMRVIKKVKKAMAGGDENYIDSSEWSSVSQVVSRGYIQFLRYYYFFKDIRGASLNFQLPYITSSLNDIFSAMSDILCRKNLKGVQPSLVGCQNTTSGILTQELYEISIEINNVFPDFKMSEGLLNELMKVKVLFFGGNNQSISVSDFNEANRKVPLIRNFLERINPHYKVLLLQWDPTTYEVEDAQSYFDRSQKEIQAALQVITDNLMSSYGLDDFKNLLNEFFELYSDLRVTPQTSLVGKIKTLFGKTILNEQFKTFESSPSLNSGLDFADIYIGLYDFIFSLRKLISNSTSEKIERYEWSLLVSQIYGVYQVYSYNYYFQPKDQLQKSQLVKHYQNLLIRTLPVMNSVLSNKLNRGVSFSELYDVFKAANSTGIINVDLSENLLRLVFNELIHRFLISTESRMQDPRVEVFQMRHFLNLYSEVRVNLDYFDKFYILTDQGTKAVSKSEILSRLEELIKSIEPLEAKVLDKLSNLTGSSVENISLNFNYRTQEMYRQFYKLFSTSPVDLNLDENGFLIMDKLSKPYRMETLTTLALYRLASDLIIRSYVNDSKRLKPLSDGGLILTELYELVLFAGPVLSELKVYDGVNKEFMNSRFLEANVFLARSNWDDKIDFYELNDLLLHIFSGLKIYNSHMKNMIESSQSAAAGKCTELIDEESLFSLGCFSANFQKFTISSLNNFPGMQKFASVLSEKGWLNFIAKTIVASGVNIKNPAQVNFTETLLAPQLLQYLEMIYYKYDKNSDGLINTLESRDAFQAFRGVMKDLAKEELNSGAIKQRELYDLFTYILKFKKPPETFSEKLKFKFRWIDKDKKWNLSVTRQDTVEILEFIAKELAKNKK